MMINPLVTLAEVKQFMSVRGETAGTDANDDTIIETLIQGVSDYFNDQCHRTFYPRYEKRYYDVPIMQNSPRNLFLDDDLLEVVTITNGDATTLASTIYNLKPKNFSPHYAIQIIGPASIFWIFNGIGSVEKVISVEGWWGFRNYYDQRGWTKAGTLGAAIVDTTTIANLTLTAGHTLAANAIVKVDTEILNVASTAATAMTVNQRGDNGSTAATHLNGASVYLWNIEPSIHMAIMQTVQNMYSSHSGQTSSGRISVTAAGVVIRPEDIPDSAQKTIIAYTRPL